MEQNLDKGLSLARRVHPKYSPVFDKLSEAERAAVALYFLPHTSEKDVLEVTRPHVIKWYCPFADQREFPSGHRYCINVYTGCEHECQYCYVTGYSTAPPNCKNRFRHDLCKDLETLDAHNVPPAPVHLSNSTDPLQPLEQEHRHTLFVLEKLAEHRNRFTTVTLLTKNPAVLMDDRYVQALRRLASCRSITRDVLVRRARTPTFAAGMFVGILQRRTPAAARSGGSERREPHGGAATAATRGFFHLSSDRPLIPARSLGRRQDDGGFRPAGCPVDARLGMLGQLRP